MGAVEEKTGLVADDIWGPTPDIQVEAHSSLEHRGTPLGQVLATTLTV